CDDVDAGRESIIKGLCIYMGEDPKDLVREYVDTDEGAIKDMTVGIYVLKDASTDEPEDIGIVLEGIKGRDQPQPISHMLEVVQLMGSNGDRLKQQTEQAAIDILSYPRPAGERENSVCVGSERAPSTESLNWSSSVRCSMSLLQETLDFCWLPAELDVKTKLLLSRARRQAPLTACYRHMLLEHAHAQTGMAENGMRWCELFCRRKMS
ncbi:hypothetical protein NQZ68_026419, partial [Dissostichus eleginoides]